jgi:hypothetical protein
MSTLEHNEQAERYQALEGGHLIAIEEDVFMIELERLQTEEEMTEQEAIDTLFDVQWWYDHLPLSGVYIDGLEQTDEAQLIKDSYRQVGE